MIILTGILIGFFAAIPLGPINIFAISQALERSFIHSICVGITSAFLDIIYSFIAVIGFLHAVSALHRFSFLLKLFGAMLLIVISIRVIQRSRDYGEMNEVTFSQKSTKSYSKSVIFTFILYVSNPILYTFWLAVAGTVTASQWVTHKGWQPFVFAFSCGLGSLLWYFLLAKTVSKFRKIFKPKIFRAILTSLGIALIGFAVYTLGKIFI